MEQPASEYAQPGLDSPPSARPLPESESEQQSVPSTDTAAAAAATAAAAAAAASATNGQYATPNQVDQKQPSPTQYNGTTAPSTESRPVNGTSTQSATDYTINTAAAAAAAPQLSTPPATARTATGGYTDYLARQPQYHPASHPPTSASPGMAQATNPSMAPVATPTYPQYATYPPQGHDMSHYAHPPPQVYGRPEWPPQYAQPTHHAIPGAYASPATTVYSFVPIPGTQQHKRPRRRYEEIERMYKCGWNGCEKAYGTLNHLNAHVTMQSHGAKRTPEEFKEIRKEWKARKKEEEAQRKAAEERERAAAAAQQASQQVDGVSNTADASPQTQHQQQHQQQQHTPYSNAGRQLPPIGYQAADGQVAGQPQYQTTPNGTIIYQTGNGQVSAGYHAAPYPHSPYGQGQQVYQAPRE